MPARKYETVVLENIVEEYLMETSSFRKIRFVDLAEYCRTHYSNMADITYQDFSRNNKIKEVVSKYNESIERRIMDVGNEDSLMNEIYLDSRDFYGKETKEIDKLVSEHNSKLLSMYKTLRYAKKKVSEQRRELHRINQMHDDLECRIKEKEAENKELRKRLAEEQKITKEQKKRLKELREYIAMNILDQMELQHLVEKGVRKEKEENLNNKHQSRLIGGGLERVVGQSIHTAAETRFIEDLSDL